MKKNGGGTFRTLPSNGFMIETSAVPLTCGVLQGSILGPLHLNININIPSRVNTNKKWICFFFFIFMLPPHRFIYHFQRSFSSHLLSWVSQRCKVSDERQRSSCWASVRQSDFKLFLGQVNHVLTQSVTSMGMKVESDLKPDAQIKSHLLSCEPVD